MKELYRAVERRAVASKAWVIEQLVENVDRAMQTVPMLDRDGVPTGEYTYAGAVANKSLELIGKELGMFVGKRDVRTFSLRDLTTDQIEQMLAELRDVEADPLRIRE